MKIKTETSRITEDIRITSFFSLNKRKNKIANIVKPLSEINEYKSVLSNSIDVLDSEIIK